MDYILVSAVTWCCAILTGMFAIAHTQRHQVEAAVMTAIRIAVTVTVIQAPLIPTTTLKTNQPDLLQRKALRHLQRLDFKLYSIYIVCRAIILWNVVYHIGWESGGDQDLWESGKERMGSRIHKGVGAQRYSS